MQALEEKIVKDGKVLPGNILKVGSFLNHQLDVDLIMDMGSEIANLFARSGATKIVTIETSGIPIAFAVGVKMHLPVVFAKKHKTDNISGDVYSTQIHSYTHNTDYTVVIEKEFINSSDKILIVDDFLANGKAINGLMDLISKSGAEIVGAACAIEKGFQSGGDELRQKGVRVESLAIIDSMSDGKIAFRR